MNLPCKLFCTAVQAQQDMCCCQRCLPRRCKPLLTCTKYWFRRSWLCVHVDRDDDDDSYRGHKHKIYQPEYQKPKLAK